MQDIEWGTPCVACVLTVTRANRQKCIALVKERRGAGDRKKLHWTLPGGKINSSETAPAAIIREIEEELGTDSSAVQDLHFVRTCVTKRTDPNGKTVAQLWYLFSGNLTTETCAWVIHRDGGEERVRFHTRTTIQAMNGKVWHGSRTMLKLYFSKGKHRT